jgi:hypothetical protein
VGSETSFPDPVSANLLLSDGRTITPHQLTSALEEIAQAAEVARRLGGRSPLPFALTAAVFRLAAAAVPELGSTVLVRTLPTSQAILAVIRPGTIVTSRELRELLAHHGVEASSSAMSMGITRAVRSGELKRVGTGTYYRPPRDGSPAVYPEWLNDTIMPAKKNPPDADMPAGSAVSPDHTPDQPAATTPTVAPVPHYVDEYGEVIISRDTEDEACDTSESGPAAM